MIIQKSRKKYILIGLILAGMICILCFRCTNYLTVYHKNTELNFFLNRVLSEKKDFYYYDPAVRNNISDTLPIGIFDSGTGGLTVLEAILNFDNYVESNKEYNNEGDGVKDFVNERFTYFGDQANMPYGNYNDMQKNYFLKELILRDALFLLGNKYFKTPADTKWQTGKQPVKLIVIACNTATANGKNDVEEMLLKAGSKIHVIGVIDAGVRGTLSSFEKSENGTAAVIATAGTVSSNGYLNTFNSMISDLGYSGDIEFFQQSGFGIAEAVDEEPNFILRNAADIRENYKGPSFTSQYEKIKHELLAVYNFDTTGSALLFRRKNNQYSEIQLNSPENYIRYHLVNLCEQLKMKHVKYPLKTLILGCTHYPFYFDFFQSTLKELYDLKINNEYIYRDVLSDNVILIDPAINTAKETHEYLFSTALRNRKEGTKTSEFYISVPAINNKKVRLDANNNFTYEYKYSRDVNHFYDTRQVPLNGSSTSEEIMNRIKAMLPGTYPLIMKFNQLPEK